MFRLRFLAPLFVLCMIGTGFLMGDDKKEPIIVTARLPTYYSRLGLTPKQNNEILKVRGKYAAEIQELKQKISDLQDQEKQDCEKLLTATQKARLREILGNSNRRKGVDDEDVPVNVDKKKSTASKDKK
ncbi:MAG TPA: hypothetical protein VH592_05985 [Gemmataceae bacterium]|jgi:hypothetical protein